MRIWVYNRRPQVELKEKQEWKLVHPMGTYIAPEVEPRRCLLKEVECCALSMEISNKAKCLISLPVRFPAPWGLVG